MTIEEITGGHTQELNNQILTLKQQIELLEHDLGRLHRQMGTNVQKTNNTYPKVKPRSEDTRLRILITGGTGFVGSHLVDKLMEEGHEVIALDNYFTGRRRNVEHWVGHPNFELVHHDVVNPYYIEGERYFRKIRSSFLTNNFSRSDISFGVTSITTALYV